MSSILADCTVSLGQLPWHGEAILRLVTAMVLGAIIGLEREHRGRTAGLRTQILVALGAAIAMVVSLEFGEVYGQLPGAGPIRVDPARVAYGVMGGIGFLGAGAIVRHGLGMRGLTTAASLWCTAAIGLACGFGMYVVAIAATLLTIFVLYVLYKLVHLVPAWALRTLTISLPLDDRTGPPRLKELLGKQDVRVLDLQYIRDYQRKTQTLTYQLTVPNQLPIERLGEMVDQIPGVTRAVVR